MVLAFCRRGLVILICLYLLVGRYMKERISGLKNESSKTKRIGLFQRITAAFPLPLIIIYIQKSIFHFPTLLYSGTKMMESKRFWRIMFTKKWPSWSI
uniref:Sdh4 n=1 Tax=Suaeda glauca TaxID=397272 RepID=UPI001BEDCDE7|nr:Sdh4 [Suaeda glauca]QTZ98231.1 Sdh4 [Suaeda glauca]